MKAKIFRKPLFFSALLFLVVLVLTVVGLQVWAGPTAQDERVNVESADPNAPPSPELAAITVDARVVPVRQATLSFQAAGTVAQVLVTEGQAVTAGQRLLALDAARERTAVSQAEATLRQAQARYDQLRAGPQPQQVEQMRAQLAAAQARLDRLRMASAPGQLAAAEAALDAAQANLQQVLDGPSQQTLIAAQAELANAEAALRQAQAAYDRVKWRNDVGALPESAALQQATNNYEAARARWLDLQQGPTQAEVDAAVAQVQQAQARVDELKAALSPDLAAAEAEVRQFQASLELLEAGPTPEELAVAQAEVAAATAALQQALVALGRTELRAPFDGTVARLDINPGEQVNGGEPVLQLADLSRWEVRTEDLTEFEVVGIRVGAPVQITFDALPGLRLPGQVVRIRPIGADQRGDIVYTAVIALLESDDRLLWNMTAVVNLAPGQE